MGTFEGAVASTIESTSAIVMSHNSALRAIRYARQVYGRLDWLALSRVEQRRVLRACVPCADAFDLDDLERCGVTPCAESVSRSSMSDACIDVLVASPRARRKSPVLHEHIFSKRLPDGAIMHVKGDVYCTSPAFTALLWARGKQLPEVLMMLMELLGSYTMPHERMASDTEPIGKDPASRKRADLNSGLSTRESEWDYYAIDEPCESPGTRTGGITGENSGAHADGSVDTRVADLSQQAHYKCEPAVTLKELKAMAKWATSSSDSTFRTAVSLVREGSASPMESVMFCALGTPFRHGGFNCCALPKGGMLLNHRIDFADSALHMASGIPYAVCDAYIPAAKACLEYNGEYHESRAARIHDGQRNNGLKSMGIEVIVVNKDQLKDIEALEAIAMHLHKAARVQFRYRFNGYRTRQAALLNGLRAAIGLHRI